MSEATSNFSAVTAGYEVQITRKENDELVINQDALSEIICHPSVGKRPILIVSIVGAFRTGKSFILNFLLKYLSNRGYENADWMWGQEDTIDNGFTWKGGSDAVTPEITIWSEPFILNHRGQEIAILLMDTPGSFEFDKSFAECVQVFSTSLSISSLIIYNLVSQIQEDNLQYLEYFMTYSEDMKERTGTRMESEQTLIFLIRDWVNEFECGLTGGEQYLEKISSQKGSLSSEIIKNFKKDLHCFLLPPPGKKVRRSGEDTVRIKDIDKEFLDQVQNLATAVLSPTSKFLIRKGVDGQILMSTIVNCWKIFKELPQPKTINEMVSKNHIMKYQRIAENDYDRAISEMILESVTIDEFESQSVQEQVNVVESYREQISQYLDSDIDNGSQALQIKLMQLHESYVLGFRMRQMEQIGHDLNSRTDFEDRYLKDMEKIMSSSDIADDKLSSLHRLHEGNKFAVKFGLKFDEHVKENIESEMEGCFDLFVKRIKLAKRFEVIQKNKVTAKKIRLKVGDVKKDFERFVKDLGINSEFKTEFKKGLALNVEKYKRSYVQPVDAKINLVLFEMKSIHELYDELKSMRKNFVPEISMEKRFNEMKWSFIEWYIAKARENKQEPDLEKPKQFIETFFEPEYDLARRINAKNKKIHFWSLNIDLHRIKIGYMEAMMTFIGSTFVQPEELEKKHKAVVSALCKKWLNLHEVETDVTGSSRKHVEIIESNLSDMYDDFKKWNQDNKSLFTSLFGNTQQEMDTKKSMLDSEKQKLLNYSIGHFFS